MLHHYDKVGLLNSAFSANDRNENEEKWIDRFGKKNKNRIGCILVSTQVCEQSVDIDSCYLVTDICPIYLLLQRLGRLWRRYIEGRVAERPECTIISSRLDLYKDEKPYDFVKMLGSSGFVYSPYILYKTYPIQ